MAYSQEIADKILEFAKLEPTIPVGTAHDFTTADFDQEDVRDTAKQLISSGKIKATIHEWHDELVTIVFRQ
ncbi:hypothetical protein [Streptococcus azizii]|uniref:Uncharacterized protein n=1 Tax=Streptococcus azizii TaxID=1579424 RepID=A0AB36JMM9_9STRE|nr:hypothetical protein [Streptococcus azizii]ONK25704.1 hypothetical protein BVE86_09345 [Streptococcus azizii]